MADAHAQLWSGSKANLKDVTKAKAQIRERFEGMDLEQRRALVRGMVQVTITNGRGPGRVKVRHLVATSLNDHAEEVA